MPSCWYQTEMARRQFRFITLGSTEWTPLPVSTCWTQRLSWFQLFRPRGLIPPAALFWCPLPTCLVPQSLCPRKSSAWSFKLGRTCCEGRVVSRVSSHVSCSSHSMDMAALTACPGSRIFSLVLSYVCSEGSVSSVFFSCLCIRKMPLFSFALSRCGITDHGNDSSAL